MMGNQTSKFAVFYQISIIINSIYSPYSYQFSNIHKFQIFYLFPWILHILPNSFNSSQSCQFFFNLFLISILYSRDLVTNSLRSCCYPPFISTSIFHHFCLIPLLHCFLHKSHIPITISQKNKSWKVPLKSFGNLISTVCLKHLSKLILQVNQMLF